MAERSPGPVKPPTIDLVARAAPAQSGQPDAGDAAQQAGAPAGKRPRARRTPEAAPAAAPPPPESTAPPPPEPPPARDERPRPPPPPPPPPPRSEWSTLVTAVVVGALVGTALTYAIATVVPLPSRTPVYDDPAPALAEQSSRIGALEERLGAIEESAVNLRVGLDATVAQIDAGFTDLKQQIAAVKESIPPAVPIDVSAINDRLRALSARIDAIAAGASSADAGALAENLADLEAALATVRSELAAVNQKADAAAPEIAALRSDVASLRESAAGPPPVPGPSIGEVALNGLEAAFAAGRPYSDELEALTRAVPEAVIPRAIDDAARTGLPEPAAIGQRFAAIVPDMLAARRPASGEGWSETAANWLTGLLAIRPSGEVAGDEPEAVLARLESAMERRDYIAADALFAKLPESMRAAAGAVPRDVALQAEGARWIATLRGNVAGAAR